MIGRDEIAAIAKGYASTAGFAVARAAAGQTRPSSLSDTISVRS